MAINISIVIHFISVFPIKSLRLINKPASEFLSVFARKPTFWSNGDELLLIDIN